MIERDLLIEFLEYSHEAGVFLWKTNTRKTKAGFIAGSVNKKGYRYISIKGNRSSAHRLAWLYFYGCEPIGMIDHIDGNKDNNKISNLRECSHSENGQNRRRSSKNSSSGVLGVHWCNRKKKWCSQIEVSSGGKRKRKTIGYFEDKESAHDAYLEVKANWHPFAVV